MPSSFIALVKKYKQSKHEFLHGSGIEENWAMKDSSLPLNSMNNKRKKSHPS